MKDLIGVACILKIGVFVLLLSNGCGKNIHPYLSAPILLPDTMPEMNAPGFWIGLHPRPDKVIMSVKEIQLLNRFIRDELGSVKDIAHYPPVVSRYKVNDLITSQLINVEEKGYYDSKGKKVSSDFLRGIKDYMNIGKKQSEVEVQFGLISAPANQRVIPTSQGLYSKQMNIEIDRLQNSALDIGTPLAILHGTEDGKWLYSVSPLSSGWVKANKVAICSKMDLSDYIHKPSMIVTGAKADIFLDPSLTDFCGRARMGTRFPWRDNNIPNAIQILLPARESGGFCRFIPAFVHKQDVSQCYLPYTPRNVISQAFKLLHAPYGWGGMFGEQDCSRFIQEVFAVMGITFPRNSSRQAQVGRLLGNFDEKSSDLNKLTILADQAVHSPTTLWMKGHIMLFLGFVDGCPYAIHSTWGYRQPRRTGDRILATKRAVVSSLRLGEDSSTGSLLKRLKSVRVVDMDFDISVKSSP